jgi:hypothetical protein
MSTEEHVVMEEPSWILAVGINWMILRSGNRERSGNADLTEGLNLATQYLSHNARSNNIGKVASPARDI